MVTAVMLGGLLASHPAYSQVVKSQFVAQQVEEFRLSYVEVVQDLTYVDPVEAEELTQFDIGRIMSYPADTFLQAYGYDETDGPYATQEVRTPLNRHEEWMAAPVTRRHTSDQGILLTFTDGATEYAQSPLPETAELLRELRDVAEGQGRFGFTDASTAFELQTDPEAIVYTDPLGRPATRAGDYEVIADRDRLEVTVIRYGGVDGSTVLSESVYQLADASEVFGVSGALAEVRYVRTTWDTLSSGVIATRVHTTQRSDMRYARSGQEREGVNVSLGVYPSPTTGASITVVVPENYAYPLELTIVDAIGREVMRQSFGAESGPTILVPLPTRIPSGTYYVHVTSGTEQQSRPFIINR